MLEPFPITGGTVETWTEIAYAATQHIVDALHILAGVRICPNVYTERDLENLERLLLQAEANGARVREPAATLIRWYRDNTSRACVARALGERLPGGN